MKFLLINILTMCTGVLFSQQNDPLAQKIIGLEKAALERWNNGDPTGYLDLSADDVTYFDPFLDLRLDGKGALAKLYMAIKGQVNVERYEMLNPKVQAGGNIAVLTFNLNSYPGGKLQKWNSTEVFRLEQDGTWKLIHSHWSRTKPEVKN